MACKYIKLCFINIYKGPRYLYSALYVPLTLFGYNSQNWPIVGPDGLVLEVVFTNKDAPYFKAGLPIAKMATVKIYFNLFRYIFRVRACRNHRSIPHAS